MTTDIWKFYREVSGWYWVRMTAEGRFVRGSSGFADYRDCLADAAKDGYLREEIRVLPKEGVR